MKDRFYSAVLPPNENGCMIWIASKLMSGYGQISDYLSKPRGVLAHRYSYALHYGPYDSSLHVLHKCDNPGCVAPEHLFLGTQSDNNLDKLKKGRAKGSSRFGESNPSSKLTEKDIQKIKKLLLQDKTKVWIGKKFGVCRQSIRNIEAKRTWSHIKEQI